MLSCVLLISSLLCIQHLYLVDAASSTFDWGYAGSIAPKYWPNNYYGCYGTHQSPVNIAIKDVRYDKYLKPFTITANASTKSNYTITNRGMNVDIMFGTTEWNCAFKGYEQYHYCYRILQMHFHWGGTSKEGSEHTINGKMYPLELHFVTWNCRDYTSFSDAIGGVNGLAVIGILFEVDDSVTPNPVMEKITTVLKDPYMKLCSCKNKTDVKEMTMEYFDVNDLFPSDRHKFFRYKGSLTTPPCTENVLWSVLNSTVKVTTKQLEVFRSLQFANNTLGQVNQMINNYRPVLPLNPEDPANAYRYIAASFEANPITLATTITITKGLVLVAVIATIFNFRS